MTDSKSVSRRVKPTAGSQPPAGSSSPVGGIALPDTIDRTAFDRLTPREQAFVMHPEVLKSALKAAVEVGYSEWTAKSRSSIMRRQLMYYIRAITDARLAEKGVDLGRIERELGAIAFAREVDYYDKIDVDGETIVVAKDPMLLPDEQKAAIKSIHTENMFNSSGQQVQLLSIVLHDKLPALKTLAELLGGFDPKNRQPGDPEARRKQAELFDYMSADDLRTVERIYSEAAAKQAQAMKSKIADKEAIDGEVKTI